MSEQLLHIRLAYRTLCDRVNIALRTQLGDGTRLEFQRDEVFKLLNAATQYQTLHAASPDLLMPIDEFTLLRTNLDSMIRSLDDAKHRSMDPPDAPALVVATKVYTGRPGRPRLEMDRNFLRHALTLRGPSGLQPIYKCNRRTIRRRALGHGLVQPGQPVYTDIATPDGTERVYASSTGPISTLTDAQLDTLIADILHNFPAFGIRMLTGRLLSMGHRVPTTRITASYSRVHGVPSTFGDRRIQRRQYSVPGPLSLVHHDGQHGLIHYKIVIHCFIDGYSRFVLAIRAHNNNKAATVLDLYLQEVVYVHGLPSRVRGDHGVENLAVAEYQEEVKGPDRGSYIWGRSVHNTRIERLWYDVTRGFGRKWKNFFVELETHHGLDRTDATHIWLLHWLFLDHINQDASEWAQGWNMHPLSMRDARRRSPYDMFFFDMVTNGPRGLSHLQQSDDIELNIEDIDEYGVDWEEQEDPRLMADVEERAAEEAAVAEIIEDLPQEMQYRVQNRPRRMANVVCNAPTSPLSDASLYSLHNQLILEVDVTTRDMMLRREVWVHALHILNTLI